MPGSSPLDLWRRFLATPNDRPVKTFGMAFLVALVAAIGVSSTAVLLKPFQEANQEQARQARMAEMIARLPGMEDILAEAGAESLQVRIVDLDSGAFASDIDPASYDQRAAAADPALSIELTAEQDLAKISRRANFAPVYLVESDDALALIVLPIHGAGYASTIYGYLALNGDAETVAGISFYEHGETPGLGSRIEDPAWQALWVDKQIVDETGEVRLEVVKTGATGPYQVDGISGATRTSDGVSNLVQFWLGDLGFGRFLDRIRSGELP